MPPKPKLLLVVTQAEFGGAQRAVFALASALRDRYQITIAAGERGGPDDLLARAGVLGIRTVWLRHLRRTINPVRDLRAVFELRGLLTSERFDLVHAHSSKAGVIASLALTPPSRKARGWIFRMPRLSERAGASEFRGKKNSASRLPHIYTAHGWVFEEPMNSLRRLIYLGMEKIAARRRATTIVLSESEKTVAIRHHLGNDRTITVIPNGVRYPPDVFPRDAARAEIEKGKPIGDARWIGTVANLYKTKGIDVLVEAADIVRSRDTSAVFVVIGDGPERERLERNISERGLANLFHLAGAVPDAGRLLPAFDIFVLPSRKEGLPFALLDAAAAGVPLVATTVGGIPEVLRDGTDALLVPPGNPTRLADSILRLLSDSALAARLSSSARERIRSLYSLERMIAETDALYRRLLN